MHVCARARACLLRVCFCMLILCLLVPVLVCAPHACVSSCTFMQVCAKKKRQWPLLSANLACAHGHHSAQIAFIWKVCEYARRHFCSKEQIQIFEAAYGKTPNQWADNMSQSTVWGDYTAIQIYCLRFNRNVAVWIPGQQLPIRTVSPSTSEMKDMDTVVSSLFTPGPWISFFLDCPPFYRCIYMETIMMQLRGGEGVQHSRSLDHRQDLPVRIHQCVLANHLPTHQKPMFGPII